jgi:hypothetical protein
VGVTLVKGGYGCLGFLGRGRGACVGGSIRKSWSRREAVAWVFTEKKGGGGGGGFEEELRMGNILCLKKNINHL